MEIVRNATVTWTGTTARGSGELASQSGALDQLGVDLPTRMGAPEGKTSPEELLAAAHAGCFAMSLVSCLVAAGTPPERTEVACEITMGKDDGGFRITKSVLTLSGDVPGADGDAFEAAVHQAHGMCGFSRLLRDSGAEIELRSAASVQASR